MLSKPTWFGLDFVHIDVVLPTVRDFMSNHIAYGPKVQILGAIMVEEDVAQNAGRNHDRVGLGPVECVHIGCIGEVFPTGKDKHSGRLQQKNRLNQLNNASFVLVRVVAFSKLFELVPMRPDANSANVKLEIVRCQVQL